MDQGGKGVLQGAPNQVLSSPRLHIFSLPAQVSCCCGDQEAVLPRWTQGAGAGLWELEERRVRVCGVWQWLSTPGHFCPRGRRQGLTGQVWDPRKRLPQVMRTLLPSLPHMLTHLLGFLKFYTCAAPAVKDRTKAKAVPGAPTGHPKHRSTWRHRPAGNTCSLL